MRHPAALVVISLWGFLSSASAMAFDFGSVTRDAVLFENSSQNARKLAILRPGTPVEIVVTSPDLRWIKVRDPSGALSWIEGNAVGKQRTVLVTVDQAAVRREAKADSPIVFEAIRDVVLEFVSLERGGWVKVRHVDGESGFVRSSEVWGL